MIHTNGRIIGITGGIATGKSTVTEYIQDKGYKVIDADKIAKSLMVKGSSSYKKTVEYFGKDILKKNGEIDRKVLGDKVFSNPKLLKVLNSLTHPFIFEEIKRQLEEAYLDDIIFLDIPLLFEEYDNILKYGIHFDEIWLVFADRDTQIKRLMKRNDLTKKEAIERIDAQIDMDWKKGKATRIIYNLHSIENLKKDINLLLENL